MEGLEVDDIELNMIDYFQDSRPYDGSVLLVKLSMGAWNDQSIIILILFPFYLMFPEICLIYHR